MSYFIYPKMIGMEGEFAPLARSFLSKNEVSISDKTKLDDLIKVLAERFEALVFNITSLVGLVAIIQDEKKVMPKHLMAAQAYIAHQCSGEEAMKKVQGGQEDAMDGGGVDDCSGMDMRTMVHSVLSFHDMKIGKGAMKGILRIMNSHLVCLLKDIRANEPLTLNRLDRILSMRRYAVFH
jgi:hypothetical protein